MSPALYQYPENPRTGSLLTFHFFILKSNDGRVAIAFTMIFRHYLDSFIISIVGHEPSRSLECVSDTASRRAIVELTSGKNSEKQKTMPANVIWSQIGILHELFPAMVDVPYGTNVPGIPPMNQKVL